MCAACAVPDTTPNTPPRAKVTRFHACEDLPDDPTQRRRQAIDSPQGRPLYSRSIATVEPVFAQQALEPVHVRGLGQGQQARAAVLPDTQHREAGSKRAERVRTALGRGPGAHGALECRFARAQSATKTRTMPAMKSTRPNHLTSAACTQLSAAWWDFGQLR